MKLLIFLSLLIPSLAFSQLTISPAPVGGIADLDSVSSTFTFANSTNTPIVMNLALVAKSGFSMGVNRCAGKTLFKNQNCYIIIAVNDSLLAAGTSSTKITQAGSDYFTVQRTKIQGLGSTIFLQSPTLAMNGFTVYSLQIQNLTSATRSYSPTISGVDASKYIISVNRCTNILSAKTCVISIALSPQAAGTYSAVVSEPQITGTLNLSSIITGSSPGVTVPVIESVSSSQSSLDFGTITRFGVTGYRSVILTNTGNTSISPSITLNGSMSKYALNRCLGILLPSRSCSIYIYLDVPSTEVNGVKSGLSMVLKTSPTATAQTISILADVQVAGNGPQLVSASQMALVNEVYSVSVGSYHSCALDSNGIARCWGWGGYGQLGAVSYARVNPIPLYLRMDLGLTGKTIAGIAASGWQTCSLTTDSKLFCNGYNGMGGGLGIGTNIHTDVPTEIDMSGDLLGLTVKSASVGYSGGCLIASNDYTYCFGDGYNGGLGDGSNTSSFSQKSPKKVNGIIQNIKMKQIAKNGYLSCSLSLDDKLYCWGFSSLVPVEIVLPSSEKAKFISIGSSLYIRNACAITQSNKLYCWSVFNYEPQLINTVSGGIIGKNLSKVVSGNYSQSCVMSEDNQAFCFSASDPTTPPELIDLCKAPYNKAVKSIGLGTAHNCSSTMDNEVYCWGQNGFGQLGDGTTNNSSLPVKVNFN